ncbi:GDSL-type esterase/lipase family protein [uncultured Ruminococcus sp.]|uniref:GDSL-type esterase/lipase family protein n=1 Tax=uncultured Ruminococcus sp. TaxID=165186 RepID=UPI0025E289C2|nr:GDSL-type esterase/lipase family protein [uncultured Ruminococcus sp.]
MKNRCDLNKKILCLTVILFILCILLSAFIGFLFVKQMTPQRMLAKIGLPISEEIDYTLLSWESSLNQLEYDADIVFIGDSLTTDENFQGYYKDKKIVNLGLSGDFLSGIHKRSAMISHLSPEKIFIEGGVNSLGSCSVDNLAEEYEIMVSEIAEDNPDAELFIQSVLPISNKKQKRGLTNENIVRFNSKLQDIAKRHGITYIDTHSAYVLSGEMNPEYTVDGVHLNDDSKDLWMKALNEYIY